jgi:DNA-binding protein H-NS
MAAKDNLEKLSSKELDELILKAQAVKATARDRKRSELRTQIDAMLQDEGFTIGDLYGQRGGRAKGQVSVARYAHPDNPSLTWTGRGRKPNWLIEAISNGATMEELAIA